MNRHLSEKTMREVTPVEIANFLDQQQGKVSANTWPSLHGLLRQMFSLPEQFDMIEKRPVRPKLHMPEAAKTDKPALSAAQIRGVLAALKTGPSPAE